MRGKIILAHANGSLTGRELELTRPGRYVLGRSGDCDIPLPNTLEFRDVSRHHCVLDVGGVVRVRDLGSCNGTFVNGQRVGRPRDLPGGSGEAAWHALSEGDELRLGGTALRVASVGSPEGMSLEVDAGVSVGD